MAFACVQFGVALSVVLRRSYGKYIRYSSLVHVIVLLFECGRALGLSAFVSNSIGTTHTIVWVGSITRITILW